MDDANETEAPTDPAGPRARKNEVAPPPADAELWTFGEVAYVLRVSVPSVRRLVDGGHLATTRVTVGDKRLIRREVVMAYLAGATEVAAPRGADAPAPSASRPGPASGAGARGRAYFADEAPRRGRPKKAATP